jgi:hypothetical protein
MSGLIEQLADDGIMTVNRVVLKPEFTVDDLQERVAVLCENVKTYHSDTGFAGGLVALREIQRSGKRINFVFKSFEGDFLKRATGNVIFTCNDVPFVKDLVNKAANSTERFEGAFNVVATVPEQFGDEPVARFKMTISMKKKR